MIAEAPTNRKMRSLSPMPQRPAIRSNDQMYSAPGTSATSSTAVASNEVGMQATYALGPTRPRLFPQPGAERSPGLRIRASEH